MTVTSQKPAPNIPDPRWLRARRATLTTRAEVETFVSELTELDEDIKARPGSGVGQAVAFTLVGLAILALGVVIGMWVFGLAQSLMESLTS